MQKVHGWMACVLACASVAALALLSGCGGKKDDTTETDKGEQSPDTLATDENGGRPPGVVPKDNVEAEGTDSGDIMVDRRFGPFVVSIARDANDTSGGLFGPHVISVSADTADPFTMNAEAVVGIAGIGDFADSAVGLRQGADLTGNGQPNLVLVENSGGAHCCYTFHLVELATDRTIRVLDVIDGGAGGKFVDLDGDGLPEFEGADQTFAYWRASYADSPAPRIVLRWSAGGYVLATDLMRTPRPTVEEFERIVSDILEHPSWGAAEGPDADPDAEPPAQLWGEALNLIYAGHPDLGLRALRLGWPANRDGFDRFEDQFMTKLRDDSLYGAILLAAD